MRVTTMRIEGIQSQRETMERKRVRVFSVSRLFSLFFDERTSLSLTFDRNNIQTLKCDKSDNVTACKEEYDEKVTVEIRLPKVDYYIYSEIEAMTFNRFISYLGGLLGILSGIQVITFIEFVVLFWRLFLVAVTNKAYA